ncbi:MAG: hypothetical protein L6R41_004746 [Letrouitia leprolyta]|nr:MAG: hypothetical protein L6R41_004746 [Letrouitia leprolyta]
MCKLIIGISLCTTLSHALALQSPPSITHSPSPSLLSLSPHPVISGPNPLRTDWPALFEFAQVLQTDLEFRALVYGATRPPIHWTQKPAVLAELKQIETWLRGLSSISLEWTRPHNTAHLTVIFSPSPYPAGNTITASRAADAVLQLQYWTRVFGPKEIGDGSLSLTPYQCRFGLFFAHERTALTTWPERFAYTRILQTNFNFVVNNYGPASVPLTLTQSIADALRTLQFEILHIQGNSVPFNTVYRSGIVDVEFINIVVPQLSPPVTKSRATILLGYLKELTLDFGPRAIDAGAVQTSDQQYVTFSLRINLGHEPPAANVQ